MSHSRHKGISRIDSGSTHGWFVRAYRHGKTYSKLFSDIKCGGREKALQAALRHQVDLVARLAELPEVTRARRIVLRDVRNATGVLGVCRTVKRSASGKAGECYSVSWRPAPGVQKCTSFSIRKYGEKEAFARAVRLRREKVREVYGAQVASAMRAAGAFGPRSSTVA